MTPETVERHESMRGYFAYYVYQAMQENPDIVFITGDLGYGMLKFIERDFPDRFFNVGAAEQAGIGIAVGMALKGKIPFFYSITNFTLYRAYEWLRNYVDHENIPVKLVGAGRNMDYEHDGFTHTSEDASDVLCNLPNIKQYWPRTKEETEAMVEEVVSNNKPCFISLRR